MSIIFFTPTQFQLWELNLEVTNLFALQQNSGNHIWGHKSTLYGIKKGTFYTGLEMLVLDLNDGQFLIAMQCRCFFYNNDAMSMLLAISYHRNRCNFFWSAIGTNFFSMVFPILGPMFGDDLLCENLKTAYLTTCSNSRQIVHTFVLWG